MSIDLRSALPMLIRVKRARIFSSGCAPETNCISRDSLLMRYAGATGVVQAELQISMQIKIERSENGVMRERNPARDKMSDSNGPAAFGKARNAARQRL